MTKLSSSDIAPLVCLLFVFFLFGILTGFYLAGRDTKKEHDCQCKCTCFNTEIKESTNEYP